MTIDLILVPQGAEYANVMGGLRQTTRSRRGGVVTQRPKALPIPIGVHAFHHLQHLEQRTSIFHKTSWHGKTIILMGLGGSLSLQYDVGDIVIPKSVSWAISKDSSSADLNSVGRHDELGKRLKHSYVIDSVLVDTLYQNLIQRMEQTSSSGKVGIVHGITTDRIISTSVEKQSLAKRYDAELVEMEGAYVLDFFQQRGANVVMVRVISDRCDRDIPDLNSAIDRKGNLKMSTMTGQFLRHPVATTHLIQGSLKGLNCLKLIASCCTDL